MKTYDSTSFRGIYRGLSDECCCGCAGTYYTPEDNPAGFNRARKRLEGLIESGADGFDEPDFVVRVDARGVYQYVGYYKEV